MRIWVLVAAAAVSVVGCGGSSASTDTTPSTDTSLAVGEQRFPDVIDAVATPDGEGGWDFDVTVSSPYDTPQRYADAWRVVGPDGTVFGVRELAHDHADEQPFTRSLRGVEIPVGVESVAIEGRDLANGWGGGTIEVSLDSG